MLLQLLFTIKNIIALNIKAFKQPFAEMQRSLPKFQERFFQSYSMNILFLTQGSEVMPASRFRVYQYLKYLKGKNIDFSVSSAISASMYQKLIYNPGKLKSIRWFYHLLAGRLKSLPYLKQYDVVYIQRETLPLMYPFTERIIAKRAKKIIFDMDDAINNYRIKTKFISYLIPDDYLKHIFRRSCNVIVGNRYLFEYVSQFTKNVCIIPTCIDKNDFQGIEIHRNKGDETVIGWIGSPSTSRYLEMLVPVFQKLAKMRDYRLKVIGVSDFAIPGVSTEVKEWDAKSEVADIASFTVGIMPLPDNVWTRGKSGTKILQYMAAGVPCIASPIGANCAIIQNGTNGFLAADDNEWLEKLNILIDNRELQIQFADAGRKTAFEKYSVNVWLDKWIEAITKVPN